jgi:hypothetical protein
MDKIRTLAHNPEADGSIAQERPDNNAVEMAMPEFRSSGLADQSQNVRR